MKPAQTDPIADIEARTRVWAALSGLYLDTDVEAYYAHIVDTLAVSAYPLDQLERILFREVHPALYPNLLSVAGEWAGFDQDWLKARILAIRDQSAWRHCAGRLFEGDIRAIWRQLAPRIAAARDCAKPAIPAP